MAIPAASIVTSDPSSMSMVKVGPDPPIVKPWSSVPVKSGGTAHTPSSLKYSSVPDPSPSGVRPRTEAVITGIVVPVPPSLIPNAPVAAV